MKKATIFVVILVYIVSFVVVGLFGMSIKSYDPKVYVEDIKITVVADQGFTIKDNTDYSVTPISYSFTTKYQAGICVKFKATVLPDNTSYKEVQTKYDESQTVYSATVEDKVYIHVNFNKRGSANFSVLSTDGKQVSRSVKVIAI